VGGFCGGLGGWWVYSGAVISDQPAGNQCGFIDRAARAVAEDSPMADKTLTRTELIASIAAATGQSQTAVAGVLDSLFLTVADAVSRGTKVTIPGWMSFERVATAARKGRNPQTGAEVDIPAGQRVKVTAGSKLKAASK
jgi:DNA-binding protein HU-beta